MVQQPYMGSNCKYNQSILLNLSMEDKYNDLVMVNPKNNKENMKYIFKTYILTKYRERNSIVIG